MKYSKLTGVLLLSSLVIGGAYLTTSSTLAEEPNEVTTPHVADVDPDLFQEAVEYADQMFSEFSDDELVLPMPEGGYLYGEATDINGNTGEVIAEYNSETDPNSITVKEAKERARDLYILIKTNPGAYED